MAKSPFFARIKGDVLAILRSVPGDAVVTYADVGRHLDVPARHVAYILKMLDDPDREGVEPAQAVAASDVEGRRVVAVADLDHGVPAQVRPADAPRPRKRR